MAVAAFAPNQFMPGWVKNKWRTHHIPVTFPMLQVRATAKKSALVSRFGPDQSWASRVPAQPFASCRENVTQLRL